ncbi:MAG: helix-turn-helix domain-containing protein [Armatimonadota bacterium]
MADNFPEMMTPAETAEYLRCHENTVYNRIRDHTLPAFKIGRRWRIPKQALIDLALLNANCSSAAEGTGSDGGG